MKKTLLIVLLALQSTAAFASTQVLTCTGTERASMGEVKRPVSVSIKIQNPNAESLIELKGKAAAARATVQATGQAGASVYSIFVTNMRTHLAIYASTNNSSLLSVYVPLKNLGKGGSFSLDYSRTTVDDEHINSVLTCSSVLTNSL